MEAFYGVHHFYGGMGMAAIGYLLLLFGQRKRIIVFGLTLTLAGALIMTDDIWQHTVQHVYRNNYASPCKRFYFYCGKRCPILYRTVSVVDRIFQGTLNESKPNNQKQSGKELEK